MRREWICTVSAVNVAKKKNLQLEWKMAASGVFKNI